MIDGSPFTLPKFVAMIASDPAMSTGAWLHCIGNDLLVARWVYLDSLKNSRNTFLTSVVVLVTVVIGAPVGVIYMLLLGVL